MKSQILFYFFILIMQCSFCQNFEGVWEGYYETNWANFNSHPPNTYKNTIQIKLKFTLKSDSTYDIQSFTEGLYFNQKDPVICNMIGYIREDSVFLREVSNISLSDSSTIWFQTMYLRLIRRKKRLELSGRWVDYNTGKGRIYFYKSNKKLKKSA